MLRRNVFCSNQGLTRVEVLIAVLFSCVMLWLLLPIFLAGYQHHSRPSCQSNLKELATAFHMYLTDYDSALPSSVLHRPRGAKEWDARASAGFCGEAGVTPPPVNVRPSEVHWVQVLYPCMKCKERMWCPSDPDWPRDGRADPRQLVSYIYKPALDRAWYGSLCPSDPSKLGMDLVMKAFRREADFDFAGDQMIFFEKKGWHWGDQDKGWRDGVSLNAAFLDGHVRNVRLENAINQPTPENSEELARCLQMNGAPVYFNYRTNIRHPLQTSTFSPVKGQFFDPRIYYDNDCQQVQRAN